MSNKDKWVRRFSVDETARHNNGFTIYKITSVLFPTASPEAVTVVSVWKRYSDVQQLHNSMRRLHAGLHLRGTFPELVRHSYFKRFQQQVIEERAKLIKTLLEFIAEHKLLFTSTDFVNFLQTGYPAPSSSSSSGTINAIRSSLHLPIEESPPLEYQTSDDDSKSPAHTARNEVRDETDFISQIPIYEAADVEMPSTPNISKADSFESINSLESIGSDLYSELDKVTIDKAKPSVKRVLPDLINFDVPSTSRFDDYHTMTSGVSNSETVSLSSYTRSNSRVSLYRSELSLSNVENKTKTEDSYVFEAGYMLNLAARYEDMKEYQRAFESYKAGIEKMLIGVQSDTDPQRRALIKEKTNKYLSYAEAIYKNHLSEAEPSLLPERDTGPRAVHCPIPIFMLRRPYEDLSLYRVIGVLGASVMLVLHRGEQKCYAMKVIRKIPNNLTEFDEYFLQTANETRQPILPTVIPYMVPLHFYIETNNLIFLILSYAPGENLFDYIKNYAKSVPTTPAREVNLENVFSEPKVKNTPSDNEGLEIAKTENIILKTDLKTEYEEKYLNTDSDISIIDRIEQNIQNLENKNVSIDNLDKTENIDNMEISVNELVINSQKLLLNVDKALSEVPKIDDEGKEKIAKDVTGNIDRVDDEVKIEIVEASDVQKDERNIERRVETPVSNRLTPRPKDLLPPSAVCRWGAEILTALESLHNYGVICRDLAPAHVLLGARGQALLTFRAGRAAEERRPRAPCAPELLRALPPPGAACDFWSFGALLYELLCGLPLSYYHSHEFTSHTILQFPDGLPLEAQSLLTQLLTAEPSERLGGGKDGIEEIKRHPYFKQIDWREVYDSWVMPD
ncbi:uncharacterized protein LOC113227261 [Hyposmocoma kahamanoa]|uniref:uncharacterized protein LOC113227261 n=1 Tax=Hyposmocoma kahamanoa TaxID=1477025 RepID=UPI000E6D9D9A|nr:uncharacterized protein LOC113227261 [Hyposmocoma kahamanoa]